LKDSAEQSEPSYPTFPPSFLLQETVEEFTLNSKMMVFLLLYFGGDS